MVIVITEKGTIEGYTAGWVASRALKGNCEWIQLGQGDPMPALGPDDDVLMFGISFSRKKIEDLQNKNNPKHVRSIFIFDNDFQVKAQLSGVKNVKINLKKTAARMAWEHLRADLRVKIGPEKKTEFHLHSAIWLVDYSERKGLWKWEKISPFFVKKAIESSYKETLDSWDELATRDLSGIELQGKEIAKAEASREPEPSVFEHKVTGTETLPEEPTIETKTEEKTEEEKDNGSKQLGKNKDNRKNKGASKQSA